MAILNEHRADPTKLPTMLANAIRERARVQGLDPASKAAQERAKRAESPMPKLAEAEPERDDPNSIAASIRARRAARIQARR